MKKYENQTFPHNGIDDNVYFTDCKFEQGVTVIPESAFYDFTHCHFKTGSIVRFPGSVAHCRFKYCTFEQDMLIDLGRDCSIVVIAVCHFKTETRVFNGKVMMNVFFVRLSLEQSFAFLPESDELYIGDGVEKDENWEISKEIHIPHGKRILYSNDAQLYDPTSLDTLTTMMWRHPRFEIGSIQWKGPKKEEWVEFQKTRKHPCRRLAAVVFALLSTRVFPKELIRGVLVGFFI